MNEYYQNVETKDIFRIYTEPNKPHRLFKRVVSQYFDGLWEFETKEIEVGSFEAKGKCFEEMLKP